MLAADIFTAVPTPESDTDCGLVEALSVTVNDPVMVLICRGPKVTVIVQLAPARTDDPQVLVCEKLLLTVMEEMDRVCVPGLLSVTVWALLLVLSRTVGKIK